MQFSIELLDSDKKIENNILNAIAEDFNNIISGQINSIRKQISDEVVLILRKTDTYSSLINGKLAGHFGLPIEDRLSRVENILRTIANNLEVEHNVVKAYGQTFRGGINIGVLVKDFVDILNMSEAFISTKKGQILPWLEWLLIRGNQLIISEHEVYFVSGKGRSGMAVMIKNDAGVWRVPPEYSGTSDLNWLIKAFTENSNEYLSSIHNILQKVLS